MTKHPKPASTVCLLRNLPSGSAYEAFEVFLMRRRQGGTFSGLHVFPGGVVDASDSDLSADNSNSVLECFKSDKRFVDPHSTQAYWVAAIRETFEESGVLLAYNSAGQYLAGEAGIYAEERNQLNSKQLGFNEFLRQYDLSPAYDRLTYMTRRITPKFAPARFDTHFFLAVLPEQADGTPCDQELEACFWMSPSEALSRSKKDIEMVYPTLKALEALQDFSTSESAFNHFQQLWLQKAS